MLADLVAADCLLIRLASENVSGWNTFTIRRVLACMPGFGVSERSLGVPAHYTFRSRIYRQRFRIPTCSFACLSGVVPGVAQSGPFGRLWSPAPLALYFPTSLSHCDGKGRLVGSPIPHLNRARSA